MKQKSCLYLF